MNRLWHEESKIIPSDGASGDWFGYDVDLSGDTSIIRYPSDDDVGFNKGCVFVFIRW